MSFESSPSKPFHAPKSSPEKRSPQEQVEAFINARLIEILEQYSEKTNEGNNGYILRLRIDVVPDDIRKQLRERGFDFPDDEQAIKILKIYRSGEGAAEAKMQKRAFEITSSVKDDPNYAQVPAVYYTRTLDITPSTRTKLMEQDVDLSGSKTELIGMEYIEGDDLASGLYREVIRRKVKELGEAFVGLRSSLESMKLQELQEHVVRLLDFNTPGGKSANEAEREFEKQRVAFENTTKLVRYLRQTGFVLDPRILIQIKNTLELLHQNGFVHRDAHHRNFMVKGSLEHSTSKAPPKAFIIDFGTAATFTGQYESVRRDLYHDVPTGLGRMNFMDDMAILGQLEELTKTKEQQADEASLRYFADLEKRFSRSATLDSSPQLKTYLTRYIESAAKGIFNPESAYMAAPDRPDKIDNYFTLLLFLDKQGHQIPREKALTHVLSLFKQRGISRLNRLQYMIERLKK